LCLPLPQESTDETDEREIMNKLKLNLGSGDCPIDGYVNIDRKNGQEAYPLDYADNSVDEIRASHILEHFGLHEISKVLENWAVKLKPGGLLKIAVPDFAKIVEIYKTGKGNTVGYLCGGQVDENDYHKSIFDRRLLTELFEQAGLFDISHWDSEISDCASLPVSLNLQAYKPTAVSPEIKKVLEGFVARKKNVYSQFGEDGIIEAIFETVKAKNEWCLEVGASDGMLFSNTRRLVEQGWNAILIESEKLAYDRLVENCKDYPNAHPVFAEIGEGHNTLDNILEEFDAPKDLDLMVIDIDGQDYHVINAMLNYKPRVLIAEFDPASETEFIPALGGEGQAGRSAMRRLGCSKGYPAFVDTQCNLIMLNQALFLSTNEVKGRTVTSETKTASMKIAAIMSAPRLGFSNNLMIATKVYAPLGIDFEIGYGVFWGQILTRMIENQLAKGMELITVLDYDSYYEKEHFLALCQLMQEHPEVDVMVPIQIKRESNRILAGIKDRAKAKDKYYTDADLIEVDAGHFGLSVFRASAFAKLKKPWFLAVPNETGDWGEGKLDEDIYFWKNWRACGLKVCITPQVKIGHMQLMITWPGTLEEGSKPTHQYLNDCAEKGIPEWCKVSEGYKPKIIKE